MSARDLLTSLLDPQADLPEELRLVALLARAGARAAEDRSQDLAEGECTDGLYPEDDPGEDEADEGLRLAAAEDAAPEWPIWREGPWEIHAGASLEGEPLLLLVGPDAVELVVQGSLVPLRPREWTRVALPLPPRELLIRLPDGVGVALRRA